MSTAHYTYITRFYTIVHSRDLHSEQQCFIGDKHHSTKSFSQFEYKYYHKTAIKQVYFTVHT